MTTGPTKALDRIKQQNLDFMQRYAEAVFKQAALAMGVEVTLEPRAIYFKQDDETSTPHGVSIPSENLPDPSLQIDMVYWSKANSEKIMRLSHQFREALKTLGFEDNGFGGSTIPECVIKGELYERGPNKASVTIKGSLPELVAQAKTTPLGRFLASEPGLGA